MRYALLGAVVLLAAGAAVYGSRRIGRGAGVDVPTAPVRKGDFAVLVRCRGEISARRSVQINAPRNVTNLRIIWLAPANGQVKAGDVVIRFDPSEAMRQLNDNMASLKQAQSGLDQGLAQARITAEQDKLDLASARYQVERARLEASKQAIVSAIQGEESKIDLASAEAKLRVQEAAIGLHQKSDESKIAGLRRALEKAQYETNLTKKRIEEMTVKAPIDGIVTYALNYSLGFTNTRQFRPGDTAWAGATIAEIPDRSTLRMNGKLDEVDRGRVAAGYEARIHLDAFPEKTFAGKVASISPLTELTYDYPPSRTFIAYASIAQPDPNMTPNMNGSVDIVVSNIPNAISVPAKAMFMRAGKPVVYIPGAEGYRTVPVEVLARNPDEVAVSGINASDRVCLAEPGAEEGKRR